MNVIPVQRSQSYEPGRPSPGTGLERSPVRGGGVAVISLAQGDRIEIVDPRGLQRCALAVFEQDGREDAAALGVATSGPAMGIAAILSSDRQDARAVASFAS